MIKNTPFFGWLSLCRTSSAGTASAGGFQGARCSSLSNERIAIASPWRAASSRKSCSAFESFAVCSSRKSAERLAGVVWYETIRALAIRTIMRESFAHGAEANVNGF